MDNKPSSDTNNSANNAPPPEVLKPQADSNAQVSSNTSSVSTAKNGGVTKFHPRTYRPSHKATFISLAVVIIILAINAGIIGFVLDKQAKTNQPSANSQVTLSSKTLSKIGVNTSTLGSSGVELVVGPNAQFDGKVTVGGDVDIGGKLNLNSPFTATSANLTSLDAGTTSLSALDVNGNTTASNLSLRNGLLVTGATQLQGTVTINQLLTVNNGVTITGNLAVGGVLSVATFSAENLTSTSTLTVNGHIITGGASPGVSAGPTGAGTALGESGTVGINGDDSAGSISINIGINSAASGLLAKVTFATAYSNIPRVVITSNGQPGVFYISSLSPTGFSVSLYGGGASTTASGALPQGGFTIDYMADQ